jgi:endoglucanase
MSVVRGCDALNWNKDVHVLVRSHCVALASATGYARWTDPFERSLASRSFGVAAPIVAPITMRTSTSVAPCILLAASFGFSTSVQAQVISDHIHVDQFGYRPADSKVAVISNPIIGYNNTDPFSPGALYEVRRVSDDAVVLSSAPAVWNGGATHAQSGDQVWWFDFSSVTDPGSYYVFDPANNVASHPFEVNDCAYLQAFHQAARVFFYQRCGLPKAQPYTPAAWADGACHVGALQDTDCRSYSDLSQATSKDLSGGWHDAGDYNKYVNFTFEAVGDLLHAYAERPEVWTDDFNLPESGNGLPDLLDEVKHELDWLLKMQNNDGSVLSIMGVAGFASASPPSADAAQRVYGPATTAATFTASALFALASIQYSSAGQTAYANTLRTAAVNAWDWGVAHPNQEFYNTGLVAAGEQQIGGYGVFARQVAASVYLFAAAGDVSYRTFLNDNYTQVHLVLWGFAYPFETGEQDALLYYSALTDATPNVATAIRDAYRASMQTDNDDNLPAYLSDRDAYRADLRSDDYTWGSNTTKGRKGSMHLSMVRYGLDQPNDANYTQAALGFVNYFHGVNPTGFCYLSNMGDHGAEHSINEFYHAWFRDNSALWDRVGVSTYGPAPGYVPGGANPTYNVDDCCPNDCAGWNAQCDLSQVAPPLNQPIQKSYKDWNADWPQNSWTITEAGIYTQASYVRLLAHFVGSGCDISTALPSSTPIHFQYRVFPDPAEGSVTVTSDRRAHWSLKDAMGRSVAEASLTVGDNVLPLASVATGLYVYSIRSTQGVLASGRLVVR